ncbi:acetyltransferase [Amedibacillus sp. YH-ame6]
MEDIVIIGSGGFGKEVAFLIERINEKQNNYNILGFLDDNVNVTTSIYGYNVIGKIESIANMNDVSAVVAIGNAITRYQIVKKVKSYNCNAKFPTLIDPSVISGSQKALGIGNIICAGNILTIDYSIGNFNIINLSCTVGHDAIISDYCTLYPSVNLSGNVNVNNFVEIGTGSKVIQGIKINENVIIGAGSVVIEEVQKNCTAVGVPARVIKNREES